MRTILFGTILTLLISCQTKKDLVEYKDGRQLLTLNHQKRNGDSLRLPTVLRVPSDSIPTGGQHLTKLFLDNADFKLIDAYIDCAVVDNPSVDTIPNTENKWKRLSGCKMGLTIKNDTILIYMTPENPGTYKFHDITILTRGKEKIYRTQHYTFNYKIYKR